MAFGQTPNYVGQVSSAANKKSITTIALLFHLDFRRPTSIYICSPVFNKNSH